VRGADAVAAGKSREALDVAADQPADRLGLHLAQDGKLLGNVLHRAVVLAQLYAEGCVVHRRGITVVRQCRRERLRPLIQGKGRDPVGVPRLPGRHPAAGEVLHRLVANRVAQVAQRINRNCVVCRRARRMAGVGEAEALRGAAPTPRAHRTLLATDDDAVAERCIEMAPHAGRGDAEPVGKLSDRGRPVLEQRAQHPVASPAVGRRTLRPAGGGFRGCGFHNVIIA